MSWLLYQFADLSAEFHYCKIQTLDHMERNQHWTLKRNQIILHIMICYHFINKHDILIYRAHDNAQATMVRVGCKRSWRWPPALASARPPSSRWSSLLSLCNNDNDDGLQQLHSHFVHIFALKVPQHVSDEDPVFNRTLRALKSHPNARC